MGRARQLLTLLSGDKSISYLDKVLGIYGVNLVAFWRMAEGTGSTALDSSGNGRAGAYSNIAWGTGPEGQAAAQYNGSTSRNNIYSASLDAAFNRQEGVIAGWAQVSGAGVWSDAAFRRLINIRADANNQILITKTNSTDQVQVQYIAGGTTRSQNITVNATTPFHVGIKYSKTADRGAVFLNGVQVGSDMTSLGTYAGALSSTLTNIGCLQASQQVWDGILFDWIIATSPNMSDHSDMVRLATR